MQKTETKPQVSLTIVLCVLPDGKNSTPKHLKTGQSCCFVSLVLDLLDFFFDTDKFKDNPAFLDSWSVNKSLLLIFCAGLQSSKLRLLSQQIPAVANNN